MAKKRTSGVALGHPHRISTQLRTARRHDVDWLRVLAVLLLIPFHTARIFDPGETNYVVNEVLSPLMTYLNIWLIAPWHMPLLFALAGASSWLALRHRTHQQYISERFKRLLIPFLFGLLVIVPPQAYLARLHHLGYTGSYGRFLLDYFGNIGGDLSGYRGLFTPAHLWFILYLFVLSLAALPLLLHLRSDSGQRWIERLVTFFARPGLIFLLALPLAATEMLPAPGGKNPFTYLLYFVYGYVIFADPRFQQILDRQRLAALGLGIVSMGIVLWVWISGLASWPDFAWQSILFAFLRNFNAWFWVVAILAYGRRFLNVGNRFLSYASEAAYPFYILHQTVIIAVGYVVVQWNLDVWSKFAIIALTSLFGSVAIYDGLIKRFNVVRFLFGIKPLPSTASKPRSLAPKPT